MPERTASVGASEDGSQVSEYQRIAAAFQYPKPPAPPPAEPDEDLGEEIKDLRRLLETQLASLAWNDLNRRRPSRARVLRQLTHIGVETALARELADQLPSARNTRDAWHAVAPIACDEGHYRRLFTAVFELPRHSGARPSWFARLRDRARRLVGSGS